MLYMFILLPIRYEVTQTIQYTGCRYEKSDPAKRVTKLRSTRNYIIYDDPEQVVSNCLFVHIRTITDGLLSSFTLR